MQPFPDPVPVANGYAVHETLTVRRAISLPQPPENATRERCHWQTRYGVVLCYWKPWWKPFSWSLLGATNWIHVGQTTGRGRMDRAHQAHRQVIKDIYVYPLTHDARRRPCVGLTG